MESQIELNRAEKISKSNFPTLPAGVVARKAPRHFNLELTVIDAVSGKPIPKALASLDFLNKTGVCNSQGSLSFQKIPTGSYVIDVINPGYIAASCVVNVDMNTIEIPLQRSSQLL